MRLMGEICVVAFPQHAVAKANVPTGGTKKGESAKLPEDVTSHHE